MGGMAIDLRIVLAWFPVMIVPSATYVAIPVTALLLFAQYKKMSVSMLFRWFRRLLSGPRKGGNPVWRSNRIVAWTLAIGLVSAHSGQDALAEFRIVDRPQDNTSMAGAEIQRVPVGNLLEQKVTGFGHDVTLEGAVNQILPGGWNAKFANDGLAERKVNWRSDGSATVGTMLAHVGNQANATYSIDEDSGVVTFTQIIDEAVTGRTLADIQRDESGAIQDYTIRAGNTLSDEMRRWAKLAKLETGQEWYVDWSVSYDYPIVVDARFRGPFLAAIRNVYATYKDQGGLEDVDLTVSQENHVVSFHE